MNQNDVIRYIGQQFGVRPNYQLARQWDACVFASPVNGRWFALLEQFAGQPDRVYLDIRCTGPVRRLLTRPHRMDPVDWRGVVLNDQVPAKVVQEALTVAFKQSLKTADDQGSERLIYVPPVTPQHSYHDQPLPQLSDRTVPFAKHHALPAPLRKMLGLYDYTLTPRLGRAKNFYVQGASVADYEDDYDYAGDFHRYFPVYHDMTTGQLRGYFTWRTKIRHQEYVQAPVSFVYVYLYELLNQIGVSSPAAGYQQLKAFQQGYAKLMDQKMPKYLHQWLQDYVIYYQLGDQALQEQFADQIKTDDAYWTLVKPADQAATAVLAALMQFASYDLHRCPLWKKDPDLLAAIVKESWCRLCQLPDESIQRNYLGWQGEMTSRPFANAVFYDRHPQRKFTRQVDHLCSYHYHGGRWRRSYYVPAQRRAQELGSLLHEIDRLVRQLFRVGRPLKPRPLAQPLLDQLGPAINAAQRRVQEARRPKIRIDLGDLDQIRADASVTRESLLTDEERAAEQAEAHGQTDTSSQPQPQDHSTPAATEPNAEATSQLDLTPDERYLLTHLLSGEDWHPYLRQHHLMASILVDRINEKLFDEIGDTVIDFDDQDQPAIVEDYRADLEDLL